MICFRGVTVQAFVPTATERTSGFGACSHTMRIRLTHWGYNHSVSDYNPKGGSYSPESLLTSNNWRRDRKQVKEEDTFVRFVFRLRSSETCPASLKSAVWEKFRFAVNYARNGGERAMDWTMCWRCYHSCTAHVWKQVEHANTCYKTYFWCLSSSLWIWKQRSKTLNLDCLFFFLSLNIPA